MHSGMPTHRRDTMRFPALLPLLLTLPAAGQAMTAGDFLDRLNDQQRASYIEGAVEMTGYSLSASGQGTKAECAFDWYFRGQGPRQLAAILPNHKALPVTGILQTLINRACP
jgi:hypothetical protein